MRINLEARSEIKMSECGDANGIRKNKPKGWVEVKSPVADEFGYLLKPNAVAFEPRRTLPENAIQFINGTTLSENIPAKIKKAVRKKVMSNYNMNI